MNLRIFIQTYPNVLHITLTAISSLFSLTMAPSFIPLTLTLSVLLMYAPILLHRHHFGYAALLWLSVTLCGSVARLAPTLEALSTADTSVTVLLAMTSFASALAILVMFLDVIIRTRIGGEQALVFPALWVTVWAAASRMPLGRLTSWSPVWGLQSYAYMAPWVGPGGIDWLVAAWATVVSQTAGIWYMGSPEEEVSTTTKSSRGGTRILAVILTALTIPAFIFSNSPPAVNPPETTTQLSVGCALPPFSRHGDTSPTLQDYIVESVALPSRTNAVILWPEGAVSFRNASDKDAGFKTIQQAIKNRGIYWAVSFEETILDSATSRASLSRTGVAVFSSSSLEPHLVYYKRHLVPIAESFPLTPGLSPPPSYNLSVHRPNHVTKRQWGPNVTRPLVLTASICLDFAMPSPFKDLTSRPALILAPARTWDPAIGVRMWEEAKQRSNEIGSLALWCDGGKGGVSGVAGGGYNEIYQSGEGSWSRTVGIKYPFNPTRTIYARYGDTLVFGASWLFIIGPGTLWLILARNYRVPRLLHATGIKSVEWIAQRRRRTTPSAEPQGNLIEFGPD